MIHKVERGQKLRYGINWMMDDRTVPRGLFIIFVFPVDLLPRERYVDDFNPWYEKIGRRLKVVGFRVTLQLTTWNVPIGKQEWPPIGEYFKEK